MHADATSAPRMKVSSVSVSSDAAGGREPVADASLHLDLPVEKHVHAYFRPASNGVLQLGLELSNDSAFRPGLVPSEPALTCAYCLR